MNSIILQVILPLVMYICVFICGFIISISLGITKSNLNGNCPLYMDFDDTRSTKREFYVLGGSDSTCNFVIYLHVVIGVLYGFAMIVLCLYVLYRVFTGNEDAMNLIKRYIIMMINVLIWVLAFIAACIVSVGRSSLCSNYMKLSFKPESCYGFEFTESKTLTTNKAVERIVLAEVTIWVSLIWWTVLIIPSAVTLWRERHSPAK